jgi:hypothetical protein
MLYGDADRRGRRQPGSAGQADVGQELIIVNNLALIRYETEVWDALDWIEAVHFA